MESINVELPNDIALVICDYCDYVQLNVLYATSKNLSAIVDYYLRRTMRNCYDPSHHCIKRNGYFLYHLKYLPVPGIIGYLQPHVNGALEGDHPLIDRKNWLVDLYANLSISLLQWYGITNIKFGLSAISNAGKGLKKLCSWKNDRSDDELLELIYILLNFHLVPHFPVEEECPKDERKDGFDIHIILYIIQSGRVNLLKKFDAIMPSLAKESADIVVLLAILSDNVDMLQCILDKAENVDWDYQHLIAALKTSDQMLVHVIQHIPEKCYKDPLKLLGTIFRKSKKHAVFERTVNLFGMLAKEKIIGTFYKNWCKKWESVSRRKMLSALDWMTEKNILTNETAVGILKPMLCQGLTSDKDETDEALEEKMRNCNCPNHTLARLLRNQYKFENMTIFPVKNVKTNAMTDDEIRLHIMELLNNIYANGTVEQ